MPNRYRKVKPGKAVDFGPGEIWFESVRNRCIKCLGPLSAGEYVVNKDMAYCEECAALLHLGESKESRMFRDFQEEPEAALTHVAGDLSGMSLEEGPSLEG